MQSLVLAADMLDYHIDDTDADQKVIQVEICVAHHENAVYAGSGVAVESGYDKVGYAVKHRDDDESKEDPALILASGQIPTPRAQDYHKDRDTDQIGNKYRL